MNYYIQGDITHCSAFKNRFAELGFKTNGCEFADYDCLYFTTNGKVCSISASGPIANIIKTHPDYKELELPVEPKFKVGDWVVFNNSYNSIYQISKIRDSFYILLHIYDGSMPLPFSQGKLIRPWTIEDAKDGDVLATDNGWTCIFQAFDGSVFSSYCFMDSQKWFCEFGSEAHTPDSKINGNIHPATKEQRDLLFKKMKEAGYQWDVDKKELRKIQPHYDIANFKPFDKVLVRDNDDEPWRIAFYGYYNKEAHYSHFVGVCWAKQCIPYNDDTKHLLGTIDPCDEQYINW